MAKKTEGLNLMALLSIVFSIVFAPAGLILGIIALKQIRETGEEGRVLAVIGIIISSFKIAFWMFIILLWVFIIATIGAFAGMAG
jgi:hypothetical protein